MYFVQYFDLVISSLATKMILAYLKEGDYNIIGVDWSRLSSSDYLSAMRGASEAAEHLGSLLNWMVRRRGLKLQDVHIIGHSLGAHVAGLTADRVIDNGKFYRITGKIYLLYKNK